MWVNNRKGLRRLVVCALSTVLVMAAIVPPGNRIHAGETTDQLRNEGETALTKDLMGMDEIAETVNYHTDTARYGTFTKTAGGKGTEYYPSTTQVTYGGLEATYVQTFVRTGSEVKEGDPLIEITVNYDKVTLAEQELRLQRMQEEREKRETAFAEQIEVLEENVRSAGDSYGRTAAELALRRKEVERDQYFYQNDIAIERLEKTLTEQKEAIAVQYINAPCDGVIDTITYFREGEKIRPGTLIADIHDPTIELIRLDTDSYRYGQAVTIETGNKDERHTYPAHIVAAPDVMGGMIQGFTLARVDDYEGTRGVRWRNMTVNGYVVDLRNVMIIDRFTVTQLNRHYSVKKLTEDGAVHKRYVLPGFFAGQDYWILDGLKEGETIIIER